MKLSDDLGFTPDIYVMDLKAGSKGQDGMWTGEWKDVNSLFYFV